MNNRSNGSNRSNGKALRGVAVGLMVMLVSCKTKEAVRGSDSSERIRSEVSVISETVRQDTTRTVKVTETESYVMYEETETITEYDAEKGTPSKVTEKKKKIESGTKAKADEAEERGVTEVVRDDTEHVIDADKKVVTEEAVKEESVAKGMLDNLGKWLGIGICAVVLALIVWKRVKKKLSLR